MTIRIRKKGTEWNDSVEVTNEDINDTFDYVLGGLFEMNAKANTALLANDRVNIKTGDQVANTGTGSNYTNTGSAGLFSISQQINRGTNLFRTLQSVRITIAIPFDGNTLGYTTKAVLYAADGSKNPTGAALATSTTITKSGQGTFDETYVFPTPYTLDQNTNYVIVIDGLPKKTGNNNYFTRVYLDTADSNFGKVSTSNSQTSFDVTLSYHISQMWWNFTSSDLVVEKSSTDYTWIGFVAAAASAGANVSINQAIGVISGFTGLSPGFVYYAAANGLISTTNNGYQVGVAISATELLIIRKVA